MEQIIGAILAVLPALAAETATSAVKDAYATFKALVHRKWGEKGDVTKSLEALEKAPQSPECADDLKRSISAAGLHEDPEIMAAIKKLLEVHANPPNAPSATFQQSGGTMSGSIGAIGTSTGTINIDNRG
jgi:hypothetical protein